MPECQGEPVPAKNAHIRPPLTGSSFSLPGLALGPSFLMSGVSSFRACSTVQSFPASYAAEAAKITLAHTAPSALSLHTQHACFGQWSAYQQGRAAWLYCWFHQVASIQYLPLLCHLIEAGTPAERKLIAIQLDMPAAPSSQSASSKSRGGSVVMFTYDTSKCASWTDYRITRSAPFHTNLARITICDVLDTELEVARHNGCDLVEILPDLLGTLEWLQIDHVVVCRARRVLSITKHRRHEAIYYQLLLLPQQRLPHTGSSKHVKAFRSAPLASFLGLRSKPKSCSWHLG